ncbi:DUF5677 domain-containing protein [Gordonia caeni]|uniref:Uncharacterized protein n=1 Tax=Gordonia caeni TaxID=1007097 RepID=A0ABP7PR06_9ACTN
MAKQQPIERSGPMAGHVKQGSRVYAPPMIALGIEVGDWVRDDVPDLLWPILVMADTGPNRVMDFVRWQKSVIADVGDALTPKELARAIDGRLTNLDAVLSSHPALMESACARAHEHGLLPESVVGVLRVYPDVPARWLIGTDIEPPTQAGVNLLSRGLLEVIGKGHWEALVKCLTIWGMVQVGVFKTSDSAMIEVLRKFPNDPETRARAETVVRASWGSFRGLNQYEDPEYYDQSIRWARQFWGVNSIITPCVRERSLKGAEEMNSANDAAPGDEDSAVPGSYSDQPEDKRQLAMDLASSFAEAIETAPQHLHEPSRQEVTSGLVMRAAREVIAVLGSPDLWCFEFGAHVGRTLVEVRIYIEWMALQDHLIYRKYQEYGEGKAKLNALIAEELPDRYKTPAVRESIDAVAALGHNDSGIDLRTVDTRDTFAAVSLRKMAEEAGLLDYYRHAYSVASGVTHSEWWSVEMHAMERCMNILHRGHLIPSLSLPVGADIALADSWIGTLNALMRRSLDLLGTDPAAVESAFAWTNGDMATNPEQN